MTLTDDLSAPSAATETDLPWHLRNNWAPVLDERTDHDLGVDGTIPLELTGTYVRTGPNPAESRLVIVDAQNFSAPPVATVHLPRRVPYGAHGSWVPDSAMV